MLSKLYEEQWRRRGVLVKMKLPEELVILILVLLPVKSLLRLKCVCKHWLSVIQSRHFIESHYRLSDTRRDRFLCYSKHPVTKTYVISVVDRHTFEELEDLEWPPFFQEEGVEYPEWPCLDENPKWPPFWKEEGIELNEISHRRIKIFGPVNGIYCIFRSLIDKWVGTLTLWNPATREYKHIHPQVCFPESFNIGFGFDHTTNDYKVVVICQWGDFDTGEDQHWHLRVYNHASDTWRIVYFLNSVDDPHPAFEGLDPPFPLLISDPPVSHCLRNGVFHWACCKSNDCYNILAFDMTSEALHLMKGPPLPTNFPLYWSVWELKDTIAGISSHYLDYPSSEDVEVWMMMEYGVENSWAKMFKFRGINGWSPVGIPYDDRVFFDDQNGQLVSLGMDDDYCVKKHRMYGMRGSTSHGICGSLGILKYVETLTTLKPV
ncbi:F-box/kelch-repeat protein At3g23880-like isoform X2 [Silene latifolia]|uniref:F-box/kelch-repeat protein At3g23880-like isoform X2 n=1 Tax=Silene latifolia TaxID=37657 RepID=UPI003D76D025